MKVAFVDFWYLFEPKYTFLSRYLAGKYEVQDTPDETTDLILCSVFGRNIQNYLHLPAKRILFSGENLRRFPVEPSFYHHMYLTNEDVPVSNYTFMPYGCDDIDLRDEFWTNYSSHKVKKPSKFCCFVVSNKESHSQGCIERDAFFRELCKYKRVDSAGPHLNNMPNGECAPGVTDRSVFLEWLSDYKFIICFENTYDPGYHTEKPFLGLRSGPVPIYRSHQTAEKYFNTEAMVFSRPGEDFGPVIERIIELDNDEEKYNRARTTFPLTSEGLVAFDRQRIIEDFRERFE